MSPVIGIPRALAYYYYHTIWTVFFSELNCRVMLSGTTDRSVIQSGAALIPDEACLPLKCYAGHVMQLYEQLTHGVDCIFVPRLVCPQIKPAVKLYCPKFIGLPDMIRAILPDAAILDLTIDVRLRSQKKSFLDCADRLDRGRKNAQHAYRTAENAIRSCTCRDPMPQPMPCSDDLRIALLGHRYLLEDAYLCFNIKERLRKAGCHVVEHTPPPVWYRGHRDNEVHPTSWLLEDEILDAACRYLHDDTVDGIVYLLSFGCGAGSITSEIIEYELRQGSPVPILRIIIDEHTGEAGFQTRLESFVDMIRIKKHQWSGAA